ncbi:hypothetical protein [Streptomyces clavuligerus]|uniref:Putative transmembrane transport protein n=1 Tax=Streptomyces clavuligerus TaxID=1901 RepID=B5GMW4_STRCL|nr:hypothetical protein [Streptomyces clavuligerus]ANW22277.1 transporter [Streptomyces clavuligerus]AXU17172.1 transporter [Streptomyces clavuligerus]EDY47660.1 transmembrane transport protein [Streptomyces clavuligerus]EFG04346.1 putative transmembrane transport protein [Streptomyces clavuligerus]MBY6307182.1 transporter [Streptomyces clavuligerus]
MSTDITGITGTAAESPRTATAPTPPPADAEPRRLLHGLTWLVWRRHRAAAFAGLAIVVALAAYSFHLHQAIGEFLDARGIRGCLYMGGTEPCLNAQWEITQYRQKFYDDLRYLMIAVLALPYLVGAFVGAPLIARELEAGTHTLVWTQSVTRGQWLARSLALPLAAVTVVSATAASLASWVLTEAGQTTIGMYWYSRIVFIPSGPALIGYTVLGFAIGAAAGVLTRKVIPSMAATLVGMSAVTLLLTAVRNEYLSPVARVVDSGTHIPQTAWTIYDDFHDGRMRQAYHPLSSMRDLQFIEAGICLALAAVLLALTVRLVALRRRV